MALLWMDHQGLTSHCKALYEHLGGLVPCSRVPPQCSEGVLATPLLPEHQQIHKYHAKNL